MSHARLVKTPAPERPELEALMRKAAKVVMTPAQIREQRKSWARGQLGLAHPEWDTADIARRVDELDESIYGTAPVSPIATQETHWLRAYLAKPRWDRRDLSETELGALLEQVDALSSAERRIEELVRDNAEMLAASQAVHQQLADTEAELAAAEDRLASLTGQVEDILAAAEPFRVRAGELFAHNWTSPVVAADWYDVKLTAGDFFKLRTAIRSLPVLPTTGDGGGPDIASLRRECASSGFHEHDGCSCSDAELVARGLPRPPVEDRK